MRKSIVYNIAHMTAVTLAIAILALLVLSGFLTCVFVCQEKNGIAAVGFSVVLGPAAFLFLSNAIGYIVPIQQSFRISAALLALWSAGILWVYRSRLEKMCTLDWPPRKLLTLIVCLTALTGFAFARFPGSDYWTYTHLPLPATIAAGNFPVYEVGNPWHKISYHYGTQLIAAGIISLTGVQLTTAHAFMPPIAAIGILFLAVSLAWCISKNWKASTLAGVLALCGTGFYWLRGVFLADDLIQQYLLGNTVDTPFKWLTPTIRNMNAHAPLMMLGHRAISMGIGFLLGTLYAIKTSWETRGTVRITWITIGIICATATALTLETSFVLLVPAILTFILALPVLKQQWTTSLSMQQVLIGGGCIIGIALLIAKFQGGPLTSLNNQVGVSSFELSLDGRIHVDGGPAKETIALWDWLFIRDYGPIVLLSMLSFLFFWKQRSHYPAFVFFVFILALGHALVPFLFIYKPFEANLNRLIFVYFGLSGITGGIYLWEQWISNSVHIKRIVGVLWTGGMLTAATMHIPVRLLFPMLELRPTPLFPQMPAITQAQSELYDWIRNNTAQTDWFFVYETKTDPVTLDSRIIFPIYTGRFPVGFGETYSVTPQERAYIENLHATCSQQAFANLGIRYLVLPTPQQAKWFWNHCVTDTWETVYQTTLTDDGTPLKVLQITQ